MNRTPDIASLFPSGFVWGAATAAYQIEGAANEDGRGESIWDRFCATPGKVRAGDTGEVACDFFHRYREDIALMRELGIDAFRFSISWPRVLPEGRDRVNDRGLDFYDRLVDALLEAGIAPFATLYHWDLPQALEDKGGWPERATAEAFAAYAELVGDRLGDRVGSWTTLNEPWVASWLGYGLGIHAPGREGVRPALAAGHHLLLAHGLAVEALRRSSPRSRIGITIDLYPMHPASGSAADREAARAADGSRNRWFLDPVFRGAYPEDTAERFAAELPVIADDDMTRIAAPIDFLGVNHYSRTVIRAGEKGEPVEVCVPGADHQDMGWEVYPAGLREILVRVRDDYGPAAVYVTENGATYADVRGHDGGIPDIERQRFLEGYIRAVGEAIGDGVPVRGYFAWSLLDNFEWALGYQRRFGLVYVDYPTLERIPKQSFGWYRDLIARSHRVAAAA